MTFTANPFTLAIYKIAATKEEGNFFMSPKNMLDALAMLYPAARNETAAELRRVCGFPKEPNELAAAIRDLKDQLSEIQDCTVKSANGVWADKAYKFRDDYLKTVREDYGAEMKNVYYKDIASHAAIVDDVNGWTSEKTESKIPAIITQDFISRDTVMVLVSAIYFFGNWSTQFKKEATVSDVFFTSLSETKRVDMMNRRGNDILYQETDDYQAVDLLYKGDELSMTIVLPKAKDGLKTVEEQLESFDFSAFTPNKVILKMPKWKMDSEFDLKELLQEMGIEISFTDAADFRNMIQEGTAAWHEGVKISKAIHKAFVDVNEEGTEAAAATAVATVRCASFMPSQPPKQFFADHPFVYMIRHLPTGNILFIGRITAPKST